MELPKLNPVIAVLITSILLVSQSVMAASIKITPLGILTVLEFYTIPVELLPGQRTPGLEL